MTLQFRTDTDRLLTVPSADSLQNECCCLPCDDPPCHYFLHCLNTIGRDGSIDWEVAGIPKYLALGNTDYLALGSPFNLWYPGAVDIIYNYRYSGLDDHNTAINVAAATLLGVDVSLLAVITGLQGGLAAYNGVHTMTPSPVGGFVPHEPGCEWEFTFPDGASITIWPAAASRNWHFILRPSTVAGVSCYIMYDSSNMVGPTGTYDECANIYIGQNYCWCAAWCDGLELFDCEDGKLGVITISVVP